MKKPKTPDDDVKKTSIRMSPELLIAVKAAAKENGRTMSQEIVARVIEGEDRTILKRLIKQNDELRQLMREMLERIDLLK
jgi:Arc-like DNA binding domain.